MPHSSIVEIWSDGCTVVVARESEDYTYLFHLIAVLAYTSEGRDVLSRARKASWVLAVPFPPLTILSSERTTLDLQREIPYRTTLSSDAEERIASGFCGTGRTRFDTEILSRALRVRV